MVREQSNTCTTSFLKSRGFEKLVLKHRRSHTLSRVVVLPENLQQLGEADPLGMEDDSQHLGVAGSTCATQTNGFDSTKFNK